MFTIENTEGQYTTTELARMNARVDELMAEGRRRDPVMDQVLRETQDELEAHGAGRLDTPVKVLNAIKESIKDPEQWSQGAEARSSFGQPVQWNSRHAVKLSLVGAYFRLNPPPGPGAQAMVAFEVATSEYRSGFYDQWDHAKSFEATHSHAEVIAAIDRAIELAAQMYSK